MAKGDKSKAQSTLDSQGGFAQNNLNNLRNDTLVPQNQTLWNNYTNAQKGDEQDLSAVKGNYQNFVNTGGFSPTDINNIRARSVSPIRAIYANANREVDRNRALGGGNSPGYGVLKSRMAREQSSGLSDATSNAEANIAQMVQQGKQFGTSGLLSAYGTTPGLSNMAGNQALNSTGQRLQGENLQGNLSLGLIGAQQRQGSIPGSGILGTLGKIGSTIYPWLNGGGGSPSALPNNNAGRNSPLYPGPSAGPSQNVGWGSPTDTFQGNYNTDSNFNPNHDNPSVSTDWTFTPPLNNNPYPVNPLYPGPSAGPSQNVYRGKN